MARRIVTVCCICTSLMQVGCRKDAEWARAEAMIVHGVEPPSEDWKRLQEAGWEQRVGRNLGLWVSVARQNLVGIEKGRVKFVYVCSTAAKGTGNRENSYQTPLGWHEVAERYGNGLPWGAVLSERKYTGKIWRPENQTSKDLILSRIMWLRGLERGVNRGPNIDSHARYIYIHGTPAEDKLGRPASLGCVRLSNDDVIELFGVAESGTKILITAW
ncbi:MAG: L,D-transpeptidase [Phycisphaerales bacterium]|nr:L,D-transpeptidase [Phycisphaerales bacterium]